MLKVKKMDVFGAARACKKVRALEKRVMYASRCAASTYIYYSRIFNRLRRSVSADPYFSLALRISEMIREHIYYTYAEYICAICVSDLDNVCVCVCVWGAVCEMSVRLCSSYVSAQSGIVWRMQPTKK